MFTPCWKAVRISSPDGLDQYQDGRCDPLTELRTLLSAMSSASIRSFSCINSGIVSLEKSRGAAPDVGPEATVGA